MVSSKINITTELLQRLQNLLTRPELITKALVFTQACNMSFHQKLEPIQYNVSFAVTSGIRGAYEEKLYRELV